MDKAKLRHFIEMLKRHQIYIYKTSRNIQLDNKAFSKENSYIIPLDQPQYRLIKSMFEKRVSFQDSLFYDVSAWTLPLAFNIDFDSIFENKFSNNLIGDELIIDQLPKNNTSVKNSNYAYVFNWNEYYAPRALQFLLKNDLKAKVSIASFSVETSKGVVDLKPRAILLPLQIQNKTAEEVHSLIQKAATENGIEIMIAFLVIRQTN